MFLGAYHFEGSPEELLAAYERLRAGFADDALDLHVAVIGADGISVYDACPSASVFSAFSTSPDFAAAVQAAGLPTPRVEPLGEVHTCHLRSAVAT
jgi:hypothetical protein